MWLILILVPMNLMLWVQKEKIALFYLVVTQDSASSPILSNGLRRRNLKQLIILKILSQKKIVQHQLKWRETHFNYTKIRKKDKAVYSLHI